MRDFELTRLWRMCALGDEAPNLARTVFRPGSTGAVVKIISAVREATAAA